MPLSGFIWERRAQTGKRSYRLAIETDSGQDEPVLPALEIAGAEDGPALLVLAGVHGDEYEGIGTVLRLFHTIDPQCMKGSLMMIPAANPYAFRAGNRISPEDRINLARAFPGNNRGTVTEKLAFELHHRFIANCDFLLDLHSGGTHYAVATLAGYYHNPASEFGRRCRAAARAFGAELLWAHPQIAPGRTVSSAQELGVPWLYTEAYGGRRVRPEDAGLFYNGTMRLLRHLGMLAGPEHPECMEPPPSCRTVYGEGNFDKSALSEADGFFIPEIPLLTELRQGDIIGTVYSLDGSGQHRVTAGEDGILVMIVGTPVVRKGDPIYLLASLDGMDGIQQTMTAPEGGTS